MLLLALAAPGGADVLYRDEQGRFCFRYPDSWVVKHRRFQHLVAKVSANTPDAADCYLTREPLRGNCRLPELASRYRGRFHRVEIIAEGPASLGGVAGRRLEVVFQPSAGARDRVRQHLVTVCREGALYTLVCGVLEPESELVRDAFTRVFRSFRFGADCPPGS